jgi:hypothetical protein
MSPDLVVFRPFMSPDLVVFRPLMPPDLAVFRPLIKHHCIIPGHYQLVTFHSFYAIIYQICHNVKLLPWKAP